MYHPKLQNYFLILLFLLLGINSCLGVSRNSDSLTANDSIPITPEQNIPLANDESKYPFPETAPYADVFEIQATAYFLKDNTNTILVKGRTIRKDTGLGESTTLIIRQLGNNQDTIIVTNDDGYFEIELAAVANANQQILILFTVDPNDNATPTSEETVLVVDKLFGFWEGKLSLNWETVSPHCQQEIKDLVALENGVSFFAYRPKVYFGELWIKAAGLKFGITIEPNSEIHSQGQLDLNPDHGFRYSGYTGCFTNLEYDFRGDYQPHIQSDGAYVGMNGNFSFNLTGPNCAQSCQLEGQWSFDKFIPLYMLDPLYQEHNDNHIRVPNPKKGKAYLLDKLFQIKITDGPLLDIDNHDFQNAFGISQNTVYHFEKEMKEPYYAEILFQVKEQPCEEFGPTLNSLVVFDNNSFVTTFDNCGVISETEKLKERAGFFHRTPDGHTQKYLLPEAYTSVRSPLFFENHLILLGTSYTFENGYIQYEGPHQVAIFVYPLKNNHALGLPKIFHLPRAKLPIAMKVIHQDLWVFDGAMKKTKYNSNNTLGSGFIELFQMMIEPDFNLVPKKVIIPHTNEYHEALDPYIVGHLNFHELHFDTANELLYIPHLPYTPNGDPKSIAQLFVQQEQTPMPNFLDWPFPFNEDKWMLIDQTHSLPLFQDYFSFTASQLLSFENCRHGYSYNSDGLSLTINELEKIKNESLPTYQQVTAIEIGFDQTCGAMSMLGPYTLISAGQNLYLFREQPFYETKDFKY